MPIHGLTVLAAAGLRVNGAQAPLYNTMMSVAAGVGLLLLAALIRDRADGRPVPPDGWAIAFGTLGLILTVTGAHMTVAWPLAAIGTLHTSSSGSPSWPSA